MDASINCRAGSLLPSSLSLSAKPMQTIWTVHTQVALYKRCVDLFCRLAFVLKKPVPNAAELKEVQGADLRINVKCAIMHAVRTELHWASKRGAAKEAELMFRVESARSDSARRSIDKNVKWTELAAFLEWLCESVHTVNISPGATHQYYVDLADQVYMSMRVPQLRVQSDRPVALSVPNPRLLLQKADHVVQKKQRRAREELPKDVKVSSMPDPEQRASSDQIDYLPASVRCPWDVVSTLRAHRAAKEAAEEEGRLAAIRTASQSASQPYKRVSHARRSIARALGGGSGASAAARAGRNLSGALGGGSGSALSMGSLPSSAAPSPAPAFWASHPGALVKLDIVVLPMATIAAAAAATAARVASVTSPKLGRVGLFFV
ncbi:hypothetical protein FOA52_012194 [Chlamydomonas sp. UWO 241]|nr:hypothetical protein FOA52_012194 [Chlamydomonas sp. UWO 241]